MNILDQRILIPDIAPESVWAHISNIAQNPTWQVDCRSVSFLSTKRTGSGVRWRYTSDNGRECVVETTAWYEGLGYEYTFVDGAPFRSSRGRIRLQEIPEGTVVQWTLNYETGGVLGGVKNTISTRRRLESAMIDSLKTLWSFIRQSNSGRTTHEAKSLMRDAPDYEARSKYQPRHPSAAKMEQGITIPEPPITDEDTRPRAPVAPVKTPLGEPDFLADNSAYAPPREPVTTETQPAMELIESPDAYWQVEESPVTEMALEPEAESVVEQPAIASSEDLSKIDTSQISVFDVFGLPKPSETQEMKAITVSRSETAKTTQSALLRDEAATVELPYQSEGRVGRRVSARRRLVNIRHP
jgi:hypothetical protein